jgi:hypothetical protein
MHRSPAIILCAITALVPASWALGVRPATWLDDQPKDFNQGKLENAVVSSLGEVTLGRQTTTLHDLKGENKIVNTIAMAGDGKVYVGTGPKGIIYRIEGSKVTTFATLPPEAGSVLSLLFAKDGRLLAGTGGGSQATIYVIDSSGKARVFHEPKGATYIWAMARGVAGEIYAATGNKGQLFKIEPDGSKSQVLADLKPKNLMCLAFGPDGFLYTGTDENGLVCRVNTADGKTFVMYDAKEPEISAIVFDNHGNLYASTADADGARPVRAISDKPGGRPDPAGVQPVRGGLFSIFGRESRESVLEPAPKKPTTSPATRPGAGSRPADSDDDEESSPDSMPATRQALSPLAGRPVGGSPAAVRPGGNAIYRIDTDGFVTEVFREPVMILAMAEYGGTIYAATGNEGRVYAVTPGSDRTIMLNKLEATQATCLMKLPDNRLLVGTANAAMIVEISERFASNGTFTSKVLDAEQISLWGTVRWNATVPTGTSLTLSTRSGNVEDDESDAWDDWSAGVDATYPQHVLSPNARFLQYRVTLETTVPDATPTLRSVEITRIESNRAPIIAALDVLPAVDEARKPTAPPKVKMAAGMTGFGGGEEATPLPKYNWVAKWTASDPNNDAMTFDVYYRDLGAKRWLRLAKDLAEPLHIWDTRTVPDGKYELRVVAKDSKSNPPGTDLSTARIADPMLVDNTPPSVVIDSVGPKGVKAVRVALTCRDALSRIADAAYNLDSDEKWIPLAADDGIFDSPEEAVTFTIEDLQPGEHRLAVRVADEQGNMRYVSRLINVTE